jgi:hypothetical protein
MTPLFTAGILISVFAERFQRGHLYFWVGILFGLAAVFKITSVGILVFLILYFVYLQFFTTESPGLKNFVIRIAALGVGCVIIQLPFLYYFWVNDSLSTMYKAVFVHTSIYAGLSRGHILENVFTGNAYILCENLLLWLFSLAAIIHMVKNDRTNENILMVAWAIGTLVIIWGQGKFFGYHYILLIGPFSVLTGFGIKQFLKVMPSWKQSLLIARKDFVQIILWVILFGNLMVFGINNYQYYRWHAHYLLNKISKTQYYEVFNEYPVHLYSFRADNDVVNYLKSNINRKASLRTVNGGGDTIIHYLTDLKSPTRFTSTWYLFNPGLYHHSITAQLRRELIDGIKKEKPDYILLIYYSMDEFRNLYNSEQYRDVHELMDFIQNNYALDKSFRDRRILYKKI